MRNLAKDKQITISAVFDGYRTHRIIQCGTRHMKCYPLFKDPEGGFMHVVHAIDSDNAKIIKKYTTK